MAANVHTTRARSCRKGQNAQNFAQGESLPTLPEASFRYTIRQDLVGRRTHIAYSTRALRRVVAEHRMELKITGFGYTWVDGDHPLWLLLSLVLAFCIINILLCRTYGRLYPEKEEGKSE